MPTLSDFPLGTVPGLLRRYEQQPRRLAFAAANRAEAEAWQQDLRAALARLLGGLPLQTCALDPHVLDSVEEDGGDGGGGYTRQLVVFQSQPGEYVPCYVLIPHHAGPFRPVIALHGHGAAGARYVVGLTQTAAEAEHARQANYDYGRQLARRGFLVFAPTMRGFAERMEPPPLANLLEGMYPSSCEAASYDALLLGQTLMGLRVWDQMRLIDYIHTRPEPLAPGLACVGLSGGGSVTLYSAALETRLTAAVISSAFNMFRTSILPLSHCACNYIPGLLQVAEMDDLAGLIAPRPVLIESGSQDTIFPRAGTEQAVAGLRRIYAAFGAEDRVQTDYFEGAHGWSGARAYDWLAQELPE